MSDKIKIAMIDDEEDLCLMVKANLEDMEGYEMVFSCHPEDAERFVKQEQPDVVLLDVVMPERKGTDVVMGIKQDPDMRHIPIIMVSGKGEMVYNNKNDEFRWMPNTQLVQDRGDIPDAKGSEALAEAYGVNDYISKPFTTDLLIEVIQEVLKRSKKRKDPDQEETP
ncbi:MAG: response regulator [Spirochaetes bacterium]|nr:response regulator [Spirochaetota bacterium]